MPSSTTPATPETSCSTRLFIMWQELVPMTRTMVDGDATPAPGTPAWASITAAETGIPGRSPSFSAIGSDSVPAF